MEHDKEKIIGQFLTVCVIIFVLGILAMGITMLNECTSRGEGYYWNNITASCVVPNPIPQDCNVYYELKRIPCFGNTCKDEFKVLWKADCSGVTDGV